MQPKRRIVISYPHSLHLQADLLFWSLQQKDVDAWMDRRSLLGGDPIDHTIRHAIETARALVVLVTSETVASEYVQFEWSCARAASVPVIPVAWGQPANLPKPWDRIVTLNCPDDGSDSLVEQILAALHTMRHPPFQQSHDLALICGEDCRSRLITKLATRHAEAMGVSVWSLLESRVPGIESELQMETAISKARLVALALSPVSAASSTLRHAAAWAFGQRKTVVTLHTEAGMGDPWPFMGDTKFLDFSGEFDPAWTDLERLLLQQPPASRLHGLPGFPPQVCPPDSFLQLDP